MPKLEGRSALIVVDVQNDFCEGGSLAVPGGNAVAEKIAYILDNPNGWDEVCFTKDWHKPGDINGGHIALPPKEPDYQDSWPAHCIAGTKGAELHPALAKWDMGPGSNSVITPTFFKGYGSPAYSGFEGSRFLGTSRSAHGSLADWLTYKQVTYVGVVGLAADYCVRATCQDAAKLRFEVRMLSSTAGIHQDADEARESFENWVREMQPS